MDMLTSVFNPSSWEKEAGGSLGVLEQPELCSETSYQNKTKSHSCSLRGYFQPPLDHTVEEQQTMPALTRLEPSIPAPVTLDFSLILSHIFRSSYL